MTEEALLMVSGAVVSGLMVAIKQQYARMAGNEMSANSAMWITYALSFIAGVVDKTYFNTLVPPSGDPMIVTGWFVNMFLLVFGASQVVYTAAVKPTTRLISNRG